MKQTLFILFQRLVPQHALSRFIGLLADTEIRWFKNLFIRLFSRAYNIQMTDAARKNPEDYKNFNDFFTRELIADCRSIEGNITSPADGTVSALGRIEGNQLFQAKGFTYSLEKLLGDNSPTSFINGSFITIYLAPHNYHRVHCPVTSELIAARYIPGKLFSVNQTTANNIPDLFADNERLVCDLQQNGQRTALIMVGAMIVAGIEPFWRAQPYPPGNIQSESFNPPRHLNMGDEIGRFRLGSTAIVLFEGEIDWLVSPGDLVKFGDALS